MTQYLVQGLMVLWSLGCVGAPMLFVYATFKDREFGLSAIVLLLGLPAGAALAVLPWGFKAYADSPVLVTLKKGEWGCTERHTITTLIPMSTGKSTIMVPSTQVICDQYSRTQ